MVKRIVLVLLLTNLLAANSSTQLSKQENLDKLFDLYYDQDYFSKSYAPIFPILNITDEKVQKKSIETFIMSLKKEFANVYDKYFNEEEIQELVNFHNSKVGKKLTAQKYQIDLDLSKTYMNFMKIAQDENVKLNPSKDDSKSVIKFDDLVKDQKNSEDIFNKEINHEGITVVKFSAIWCGPCKMYAPIFNKVADKNTEIKVDGKTISIKYLAIDTDNAPEIAKLCKVGPIPATHFYKNGNQIETLVGLKDEDTLLKKLEEIAKK